jgi:uncharacterized Zn finger protein
MKREILKKDLFEKLSWHDLEQWAGSRVLSRGQGYHRDRKVQGLAQIQSGGIVAWVQGARRYATEVDFKDGELISVCTCPYGNNCKHAVAAVLEYLEHLKENREIPQITGQDPRVTLLQGFMDDEDIEDDYNEEEEEIETKNFVSKKGGNSIPPVSRGFLEGQTKEQLISLVKDLSERYTSVRKDLQDRENLSKGSVKRIVASVRKEIQELSSEPGWRNHWDHEGYTPDYSQVKGRLKSLLANGHADEVVALGKELLEAGIRQVEMSDDEGETGNEISSCLDIVFQALPQSTLSPVEQILWVIDAELEDEYELCYGAESFWKKKQKASDWNIVADRLLERLNKIQPVKGEDSFSPGYHRDNLTNRIIRALENSGRHKEVIPLCEREAGVTGSYTRLVDVLRKAKRSEEAEQWIHKGIKATQKQLPGIAKQLKDTLREMREREGNWLKVAAFRTEDFLQSPSFRTFKDMKKAAEKAKSWPEVRAATLLYLETGKLPQSDPTWPLPETGVEEDRETRKSEFPMIGVLIDIAIEEKRPDEVLRWYDQRQSKKQIFWGWDSYQEDQVAEAVADHYPDRALAIWRNVAQKQIALTKPRAYEAAAVYLRKVNSLLKKLRREEEWKNYLLKLRQDNARKSKLIEILSRLEGRRILEKTQ